MTLHGTLVFLFRSVLGHEVTANSSHVSTDSGSFRGGVWEGEPQGCSAGWMAREPRAWLQVPGGGQVAGSLQAGRLSGVPPPPCSLSALPA